MSLAAPLLLGMAASALAAGEGDGGLRRGLSRLREAASEALGAPPAFPTRPPAPARFPNAEQAERACADLPPAAPLRLAVIGDAEPGKRWFQRMFAPRDGLERHLERADALYPDLIVQLGDFVVRGDDESYREFRRRRAAARAPMVLALGNHDRANSGPGPADKSLFFRTFGGADLAFDCGAARLVLLDNADQRLSPGQLAWLDAALDTPRRKLVFMHIPPVYLHGRLVPASRFGYPDFGKDRRIGYFTPGAEELREILGRRRVDRVYMGHIHALASAEVDGVRYILTAGGGSPLYPLPKGAPSARKAHFLWVEADGGGLRELVRTTDGFEELP